MNKPTVDLRMVLNCFSVAAITALSVWHAYHFYHARITNPTPSAETVRFDLEPAEAPKVKISPNSANAAQQ